MGKKAEETKRVDARQRLADRLGFLLAKRWIRLKNAQNQVVESGRVQSETREE